VLHFLGERAHPLEFAVRGSESVFIFGHGLRGAYELALNNG
jgi:hypothetical protein